MAVVTFYEKPGCSGNAKQKKILEAAGHTVVPRDLFKTPWTEEGLRAFFGTLPVAEWFNANSAGVKSGEIVPADYDEAGALAMLRKHPPLIRRQAMSATARIRSSYVMPAARAALGKQKLSIGSGRMPGSGLSSTTIGRPAPSHRTSIRHQSRHSSAR